jgi:uncharacterized protein
LSFKLADKKKKLERIISRENRAAVACSGGVDSTLLLQITHNVLGHENTIAVFAKTPLLPPGEAEAAREVVNLVGSRLLTVSLNPLDWPEFTENPKERCYLCKNKIYHAFLEKLEEFQFSTLMDGTNLDDLHEYRPGLKALQELHVRTPLADAGLTKDDIRQLSRDLNLPNWDKFSSSCLATRVATGEQISMEKLGLIKKCENFLQTLDFFGCRVRIANDCAVIEIQENDIKRFAEKETRRAVSEKFNDFRIKKVSLDICGRKGICF